MPTPLFDYEYCAVCFHHLHKTGPCAEIDLLDSHPCGCEDPVSEAERGQKVVAPSVDCDGCGDPVVCVTPLRDLVLVLCAPCNKGVAIH